MRFYIIARNYVQGMNWIEQKRRTDENFRYEYPNRTDLVIVTKADQLRGCEVERGILLEGWRDIPNIEVILWHAVMSSHGTNPALKKAYEEIQLREEVKKTLSPYMGMTYHSIIVDELAQQMSDTIDQEILGIIK